MNPRGTHHASTTTARPAALRRPAHSAAVDKADAPAPAARQPWTAPRPADPPLIRMLFKEANRRGDQLREMAEALGCTYGYINQLRSGIRQTEHVGQAFAQHAGRYLGVPTALVKLIAGRLTIQDFAWPQRDPVEDMAECLEALRDDPVVGALVPQQLFEAEPAVQRFVWQLYTECTDLHPGPSRALPRMLEYLQRAALNEAEFELELARLREAMAQPGAQATNRN